MGYRVAVVGATGAVGREMLNILAERNFPADEIIPLASERSAGATVDFAGKKLTVKDLAKFDFKGIDIGLFSPGAKVSAVHAPRAAAAGAVVIDNTSQFRYDPEIPLVVPEVNADVRHRGAEHALADSSGFCLAVPLARLVPVLVTEELALGLRPPVRAAETVIECGRVAVGAGR
jgi:aspartate-semialdehyde dehydrogenase